MTGLTLIRESEKYSHFGNISADGIQKLLGTPNLDRLQTVIRETVQNSWDARDENCTPRYAVHLRELSPDQIDTFRNHIFCDLLSGDTNSSIKNYLDGNKHWVLEIGDFGTEGLGGATDPSLVPEEESTDFVDFMRNIGTPRDTDKGGGTYGYGKSCLYSFSQCSTVLVDTLTKYQGSDTRRLMGCRINHRFDVKEGGHKGRYTGRHWWGMPQGEGIAPASDSIAEELSAKAGLLQRNRQNYGTTIAILDPDVDTDNPEKAIKAIAHALLWNFWPKMLEDKNTNKPGMQFEIWLNGERQELLTPDDCPPLNIFADAMRKVKAGEGESIICGSPKKLLGQLAIVKAPIEDRHTEFGGDSETAFPEVSHHVALMRPAELVIKYLEGPALPGRGEWGGVFICDVDNEVESAFAASEPPAHDDWVPNNLPKGHSKTFVRVALRNIQREVDKAIGSSKRDVESGNIPMSKAANFLGEMLSAVKGDGLGEGGSSKSSVGAGKGKKKSGNKVSISDIRFEKHAVIADRPCMIFSFEVNGPENNRVRLHSKPGIVLDGGQVTDKTPSGEQPEVKVWYSESYQVIEKDTEYLEYSIKGNDRLLTAISLPEKVALSLNVTAEVMSHE